MKLENSISSKSCCILNIVELNKDKRGNYLHKYFYGIETKKYKKEKVRIVFHVDWCRMSLTIATFYIRAGLFFPHLDDLEYI